MPGQGFEFWGPKIQNLNIARFLFNPDSNSKQVPQLVKKILVKPKCFYDFLHGYDKDSSNSPSLNPDEKGKWKVFKGILTEVVTEQFQAGLILQCSD
ncbi:hypothetical protein CAEBREN_01139 [Caenorhabditis brenneri]|uniref:Uncharacterized protein n=1 Tax=Caenorhabditis brenneri TaxID=135651 RepID=G0NKE5_CAEBE|nr:hypothetical protein CAEBREN_01139 [Caenorhabditis brenneri]